MHDILPGKGVMLSLVYREGYYTQQRERERETVDWMLFKGPALGCHRPSG